MRIARGGESGIGAERDGDPGIERLARQRPAQSKQIGRRTPDERGAARLHQLDAGTIERHAMNHHRRRVQCAQFMQPLYFVPRALIGAFTGVDDKRRRRRRAKPFGDRTSGRIAASAPTHIAVPPGRGNFGPEHLRLHTGL